VVDVAGQRTDYRCLRTGEVVEVRLPDGTSERFEHDAAGLPVRHTDPLGRVRTWQRNAAGQVIAATDPAGRTLHYQYDPRGRLTALANANGAAHRFAYDHADRLVHETQPDGIERRLHYDAAGHLVTLETLGTAPDDPNTPRESRRTDFERDALGRLLAQHSAPASTHYQWDTADRLTEARREPTEAGQALGIAPDHLRFDYDAAGRLIAHTGRVTPEGSSLDPCIPANMLIQKGPASRAQETPRDIRVALGACARRQALGRGRPAAGAGLHKQTRGPTPPTGPRPGSRPTADYPPSLRSPWRGAHETRPDPNGFYDSTRRTRRGRMDATRRRDAGAPGQRLPMATFMGGGAGR
jgi:YD repeat-containing protein